MWEGDADDMVDDGWNVEEANRYGPSANQTMSRDMWRKHFGGGQLKVLKYNICHVLKLDII
jgi:hypothetical protein